ncbi:hypothetical protein Snov_4501 [Ancylobacter novellus DSM 506]|uniref:Uncharacterized protein n=1 Tax=Ancylobacter novellus (strain ATCC 8093 / DSM 506 / JCM 20403 / CCM 1077 / IAM 12100 / NBRC 12443 / NCIMB 10456) TaxID=639283 RepID=D7A3Y0_ANCN5|nr:Lar family restriction alleviation protein [Ancylobacter novellus]ADH91757.1 hypothetical protein Snov_4501 [Ancylobacter novellus DSM 506]
MISDSKWKFVPCPFCGGWAELRQEGREHFVACGDDEDCGAEGHRALVDDYAVESWNRRAASPQPPAPGAEVVFGRFWIIATEIGCTPDRKGPFRGERVCDVIREFMKERPQARLTYLTVDEEGTPWVQHAPELLQMLDGRSMSSARKHNECVRRAESTPPTAEEIARRAREEALEEAAYFLGRAREAEERRDAAEIALEPFADVAGEGDEDFPNDTKCTVQMGRSTYYALMLGHFRRATQVINAIPVGDDETRECLGCAHLVKLGDKVQDEASGEIFCEACAYSYAAIKADHDECSATGIFGELDPESMQAFAEEYAAHLAAGGSPDDKPLYVLGKGKAP